MTSLELTLSKIPNESKCGLGFAKLFFWGKGLAKPRLFSRPQEGSGEESAWAGLPFFLWLKWLKNKGFLELN